MQSSRPPLAAPCVTLFVGLSELRCDFFHFRPEDDHQRAAERREAARRSHDAYDILPYGFRPLRTAGTHSLLLDYWHRTVTRRTACLGHS